MKKILIHGLILGALSTSIYADLGCISQGCFGVTVDRLFITSAGTVYIGTSGDESSLACTSPNSKYMSISTDTGKNAIYAAVLTAKTTRKKLNFRIMDNSPTCRIAYIY